MASLEGHADRILLLVKAMKFHHIRAAYDPMQSSLVVQAPQVAVIRVVKLNDLHPRLHVVASGC